MSYISTALSDARDSISNTSTSTSSFTPKTGTKNTVKNVTNKARVAVDPKIRNDPYVKDRNKNTKNIEQGIDVNVDTSNAATYNANTQAADKSAYVQNRLNDLIDENSSYMQRAKALANDQMSARGLKNSSMAIGASHAAAIDAALPIAQQDAETSYLDQTNIRDTTNRQREFNTTNRQDMRQFNTEAKNVANMKEADILAEQRKMYIDTYYRKDMMKLEENIKGRLSSLDNRLAMNLESLKGDYEILQNLDTVSGTIYADGMKSLSNILENNELSPAQRRQAVETVVRSMESGLKFLGGLTPKNFKNINAVRKVVKKDD